MKSFIATNEGGDVVARYKQHNEPLVPDGFEIQEVESLDEYPLEAEVQWFP